MACQTCRKNREKAVAQTNSQPHDYVAPDGTRTTYQTREQAIQARRANAGYGRVVPSHK